MDEYAESTVGVVKDIDFGEIHHEHNVAIENPAYDCRKMYEEHSIMANETKAWNRVMDGWWLRLGVCRCNDKEVCISYSSEKYKRLVSQSSGFENLKVEYSSQCPKGFSELQSYKELPVSQAVKKTIDDRESLGFANSDLPPGFDFEKDELTFRFSPRPASHNNLLEPRHFNAIVYPGCVEKNHEYYQNSQNAYRTSMDHGGLGCADMSWAAAK